MEDLEGLAANRLTDGQLTYPEAPLSDGENLPDHDAMNE